MISVCMATYNGEKYIEEQLLSILHQNRQPDEVIICDDCSADGTVEKIRDFIAQNGLADRWRLFQNKENKGYPGNFYYAMGLCRGDIVFLADQDDIWSPQKLEVMGKILEKHPHIAVLSCTMGIVDAQGRELHGLLAPRKADDGKLLEISMDDVLYKDCWAGMTMAYQNSFYQKIRSQVENTNLPHDRALWTIAAQEQAFCQINRVLSCHRRHDSNTCEEEHRIAKVMRLERKLWQIDTSMGWLREFLQGDVKLTEESRDKIQCKYRILESRRANLQQKKIGCMVRDYWRYRRQTRLISLLGDIGIVVTGR